MLSMREGEGESLHDAFHAAGEYKRQDTNLTNFVKICQHCGILMTIFGITMRNAFK